MWWPSCDPHNTEPKGFNFSKLDGKSLEPVFDRQHDFNHLVTSVKKPTIRKSLSLINYLNCSSLATPVLVHIPLLGSTKVHAVIKNLHFTTSSGHRGVISQKLRQLTREYS